MAECYTIQMTHESSLVVKDDQDKTVRIVPSDVCINSGTDSWSVASMVASELGLLDPEWVEHDKGFIFFGYEKPSE